MVDENLKTKIIETSSLFASVSELNDPNKSPNFLGLNPSKELPGANRKEERILSFIVENQLINNNNKGQASICFEADREKISSFQQETKIASNIRSDSDKYPFSIDSL